MPSFFKKQTPIEKSTVSLGPLSVGDTIAIVFTTIEASATAFFKAAKASSLKSKLPTNLPARAFSKSLHELTLHRKGSIYASVVTSIDGDNVFHPTRFAFALKRLGVIDDISASLDSFGLAETSDKMANAIPWFWADAVVIQLNMVKKEVKKKIVEAISLFPEESSLNLLDQMIEEQVTNKPPTSGLVEMAFGIANFETSPATQQAFRTNFRQMAQTRNIGFLDKNSSLEAIFESFRQHILADPSAIQKLLPNVKYGNESFSPRDFQNIFRNKLVVTKLRKAFFDSYDKVGHTINITRLYMALNTGRVEDAIGNMLKAHTPKRVTKNITSGIIASVVGLFFSFTGDTKGQSLPMMDTIKRATNA